MFTSLLIAAAAAATLAPAAPSPAPQIVPPLLHDDEAIVVSQHRIVTHDGVLAYEARAGRLPIRNDETGEVRGYLYFTAYVVKPKPGAAPRPLTFLWNGGPTAPSLLLHTEMFGPRRLTAQGMVDNAETLLTASDLVFYDPVGTGFSRAVAGSDKEFLTTLGDFAEAAEFVRAWRVKFGAERQPLFLAGESYGTWRVNGTTELLEKRGIKVAGAILISGGVPGSLMPPSFQDAMYVPARTATAFALNKLAPDLMRDKTATMQAVGDWAIQVYKPALDRIATLSAAERETIAQQLAHYIGVRPEQIDRTTLVMSNNAYKKGLFEGDASKMLDTYDMRLVGKTPDGVPDRAAIIGGYLRGELGYRTDMAYAGMETGYMPYPGPELRETGARWTYNHVALTPEVMARMNAGGGPPLSQPWLQNAMRQDPALRVYVAAGRYDSLNMCEGNRLMSAKLEPALAARFTHACYEGGHMMYRMQPTRLQLSQDIARFIAGGTVR